MRLDLRILQTFAVAAWLAVAGVSSAQPKPEPVAPAKPEPVVPVCAGCHQNQHTSIALTAHGAKNEHTWARPSLWEAPAARQSTAGAFLSCSRPSQSRRTTPATACYGECFVWLAPPTVLEASSLSPPGPRSR